MARTTTTGETLVISSDEEFDTTTPVASPTSAVAAGGSSGWGGQPPHVSTELPTAHCSLPPPQPLSHFFPLDIQSWFGFNKLPDCPKAAVPTSRSDRRTGTAPRGPFRTMRSCSIPIFDGFLVRSVL